MPPPKNMIKDELDKRVWQDINYGQEYMERLNKEKRVRDIEKSGFIIEWIPSEV